MPRRRYRGRLPRARASRPGRRSRRPRATRASSSNDLRIEPALDERPLESDPARWLDPEAVQRWVAEDIASRASRDQPAGVDHDYPMTQISEQVGLVLRDEQPRS